MLLKSTIHAECHTKMQVQAMIWSNVLSVVNNTMVVVKISPMLGSTNQKIGFANNLNDLFKEKISKNKQTSISIMVWPYQTLI